MHVFSALRQKTSAREPLNTVLSILVGEDVPNQSTSKAFFFFFTIGGAHFIASGQFHFNEMCISSKVSLFLVKVYLLPENLLGIVLVA